MDYTLSITDVADEEVRKAIVAPLVEYNTSRAGPSQNRPLCVLVKDGAGAAIGGLWGNTGYDWLFTQLLVVPASLRGRGVGSEIMKLAEREAVARGCRGAWLDTFEFQARGFYERIGYECFGEIPNHPRGFSRFFMKKALGGSQDECQSLPMEPSYTITTDARRFDLMAIHAFLSQSYWSPGVPLNVVEKAVANSLAFGILLGEEQVGFARVVTDKATFAYLADVYVVEAHRGKGLSKRLLEEIHAHPDLQGLRRFLLATRDAHSLYAQFGFTPLANPPRMMEKWTPNVYNTPGVLQELPP